MSVPLTRLKDLQRRKLQMFWWSLSFFSELPSSQSKKVVCRKGRKKRKFNNGSHLMITHLCASNVSSAFNLFNADIVKEGLSSTISKWRNWFKIHDLNHYVIWTNSLEQYLMFEKRSLKWRKERQVVQICQARLPRGCNKCKAERGVPGCGGWGAVGISGAGCSKQGRPCEQSPRQETGLVFSGNWS